MKKYFITLAYVLFSINSYAKDSITSSQNEIFDNPFISIGVSQKSNTLTGYFSALLTAPGKTDACKFAFSGMISDDKPISLSVQDVVSFETPQNSQVNGTRAQLSVKNGTGHIFLPKSALPGDCNWILDAVGAPAAVHEKDGFSIDFKLGKKEDWIAVNVIKSKKAFFYASSENSSSRKTFLVTGDSIYIYDEKPDWYYVKFSKRNKETTGWIKKSDTLLNVP